MYIYEHTVDGHRSEPDKEAHNAAEETIVTVWNCSKR